MVSTSVDFGYTTTGASFDGVNDWLSRDADLTGNADSKLWTGSFWFKGAPFDGGHIYCATDGGTAFARIQWTGDAIGILARNSGGTGILDILSSGLGVGDTGWHHCLFSLDLSDTNKRHLYIDDASDLNVNTYTNDTIDFSQSDHLIVGGPEAGVDIFAICLADMWIAPGVYLDFSVEANRRLFVTSDARPIDLGDDGSTPTGSAPLMYFSGALASWETNKGTGGGFTENGALTECAVAPPSGTLVAEATAALGMQKSLFRSFTGTATAVAALSKATIMSRAFAAVASITAAIDSLVTTPPTPWTGGAGLGYIPLTRRSWRRGRQSWAKTRPGRRNRPN